VSAGRSARDAGACARQGSAGRQTGNCMSPSVCWGVIGRNAQMNLKMRTLGTWRGTGTGCAEY
jgi:hypothetical protein